MLTGLDGGRAVAILPVASKSLFPAVVGGGGEAFEQLHAVGNLAPVAIAHDEVKVVAGDLVVEDAEIETLAGLEESGHPQAPVARKLQQEVSAVAAMGEVPDVAGQVESIGAGHGP